MPASEHGDPQLLGLGLAVARLRTRHGMSIEALARAAGTTPKRVEALERGQFDPPYELLLAIADGLRVDPAVLVALAEELASSDAS